MGLFTRDQFGDDEDDAGVFMSDLGRALVIWTAMQDRVPVMLLEAAMSFNTSPEIIREAVEDASWISVQGPEDDPTKQFLEVDGE